MLYLLLFSCKNDDLKPSPSETLNLTESLNEEEVRAGIITDPDALFGGSSAEGQVGDYKIYNNRVRFVVQSDRASAYYVAYGGGLLDADIIRSENSAGRDLVDEHTPMAGFGRILKPQNIEIVNNGSSGQAHIRVTGTGAPFELLQGAVENEHIIPQMNVSFEINYKLGPNSNLLEIETTITWLDEDMSFQAASVMLLGKELLDLWNPGEGFYGVSNNSWYGAVGKQNEIAIGLFPSQDTFVPSVIQSLLEDTTPAMSGFDEMSSLTHGTSITSTHYVGVGRDLATLTDEWYDLRGVQTQVVSGIATSNDNPVAGARVHVFDGEEALTLAITEEDGSWSAQIPEGAEGNFFLTGRGRGLHYDIPPGAGWYGIYGEDSVRERTLDSIQNGAEPIPFAEGYGVGEENSNELVAPAEITITTDDGGPGVVLIDFLDGDPSNADHVSSRPSGHAAMGYIRDGDITITVEPGSYRVITHRGAECEYDAQDLELAPGESTSITATIECIRLPDNLYTIDPHAHSSPSGDARISMSQRAVTHAAHGIDVHVSTEHDHIVDFGPLISALDLNDHLGTIIGSEVSPPLRGHHNTYPMTPREGELNHGAPQWWSSWTTTEDLYETMRSLLPSNGVIQSNHPIGSSGLFDAASYNTNSGTIGKTSYWSSDFDAMELINDAHYQTYLPYYFDLISRGHNVIPVSVSDSHSNTGGVGVNRSYVLADSRDDDDVIAGMRKRHIVPSSGPYIHATIENEWAPGNTFTGVRQLNVELYHPSWMLVDSIHLYENGIIIDTQEATTDPVIFDLAPEEDAHYSVVAEGAYPMVPIYSSSPWSITAALYIDIEGDGWTPPLPELQ